MFRKLLLPFLVIQVITSALFAQSETVDSLLAILKKDKPDTNKVIHLNKLSREYVNIGSYDTAMKQAKEALQLAAQLVFKKEIANAYNNIGVIYYKQGNYDKALENHLASLMIREETGDKSGIAASYNNLGVVYLNQGNYDKALENNLASLKIREETGDKSGIAASYNNIGLIYHNQGNYSKALENYFASLKIRKETGDKQSIGTLYNNIGVIYYYRGDYDKALENHLASLEIKKATGDKQGIAASYDNIGDVYKSKGNTAKALENYLASLRIQEEIGDKHSMGISYISIGNIYKEKLNYKEAIAWLQKGQQLAKELGSMQLLAEAYKGLSEVNEKMNDYHAAYRNHQLYSQIKDSIFSAESSKQIAEMQTKYETVKKDNQIKILEKQDLINSLEINEQNLNIQKRNYLLVAVLLLFLMLSAGIYLWFRKQQFENQIAKEKIIKETEENERLRLAKDIHDDLGSGLSKINFLSESIYKKSELLPDMDIRKSSESIKEATQTLIENMRDLIWALNPENTTLENLIAHIREYSTDYLEDFSIELKTSFPDSIPQTSITKKCQRELFMVVKESLNNISKHSKATRAFFNIALDGENLSMVIEDNGVGFNSETLSNGNGLRNMQSRIKELGGIFDLTSNSGKNTVIKISIPIQNILKL